ncbi:unnamed protein product [Durusdinium trenchii]|uniref:Uncharacterized protein n=1 Tax=Durusdinium trenchii TaxID=1381693 RepID=A0ABP0RMM7_9DINO
MFPEIHVENPSKTWAWRLVFFGASGSEAPLLPGTRGLSLDAAGEESPQSSSGLAASKAGFRVRDEWLTKLCQVVSERNLCTVLLPEVYSMEILQEVLWILREQKKGNLVYQILQGIEGRCLQLNASIFTVPHVHGWCKNSGPMVVGFGTECRCLGVPGKAEALAEIDRGRSEQVVIVGFDGGPPRGGHRAFRPWRLALAVSATGGFAAGFRPGCFTQASSGRKKRGRGGVRRPPTSSDKTYRRSMKCLRFHYRSKVAGIGVTVLSGTRTIHVVAAVVGYGTNWVGVKMIFYPIEFLGVNIRRWPETPLGFIGWQGIVPCKTGKMSRRLVDIITEKLLSLKEAFSRLDAAELAQRLEPSVAYAIEHDAAWGEVWISVTRPQLRSVLTQLVQDATPKAARNLLDLRKVVSSAFLKDKVLLGELFQKAGRKELEFLVNSGLSFGFFLGILQMLLWICFPNNWVLPVGGALVGYITNWVAIKLIFDPVEPTQVGPFVFQGLFEKRQVEVSQEFSEFLADRVLTSQRLIDEIANGQNQEKYQALVRKAVPGMVPDHVVRAAANALKKVALEPKDHPVHAYVDKELRLQDTLFQRLCKLTAPEFENLLHPVFQEDELTLIVAGGVLGAFAGFLQMSLGWGGPSAEGAVAKALRLSAGAGAGAAATKMALLPPWRGAVVRGGQTVCVSVCVSTEQCWGGHPDRAMPKRKACPSLDADPCGIGLLYLTADEVNMIREKLDQMKRARISGWEWVLEATDTQRCASTKRGLDTKETPAKEVKARKVAREATKAPEKAAAAKGKTPKAARKTRAAKAKAKTTEKKTAKTKERQARKAAIAAKKAEAKLVKAKEAREAKLAKAQAAERTAAKASAKAKSKTPRRPAAKGKPKATVMACPLDQQGRDYMLDLIVQISEDHKRRLFESYREIVHDVHCNEVTLDFDHMTWKRRRKLQYTLEFWAAQDARAEPAGTATRSASGKLSKHLYRVLQAPLSRTSCTETKKN